MSNNNQKQTIFHSNKRLADYLLDLPYPYNIEAYANFTEQTKLNPDNIDPFTKKPIEKLSRALMMAFVWSASKEGNDYWNNLHIWLLQKEENGN